MSKELEAFIEYITVIKALSPRTITAYSHDLNEIEHTSEKSLTELDSNTVFRVLGTIANKRTLNRKLSAFNSFLDFCHRNRFNSVSSKFALSKVPKNLPKYLSFETIQSGLRLVDRSEWIGLRDYALLLFLYATGVRVSECLMVEEGDIEGEWLRIRHGKGEKERYVPIAPEALKALRVYQESCPYRRSHLWLNYRGESLSRISAFKITQKYLGVSPHALRHSYATALILGGADLRVVQELLGHASLLTTQIYTHVQKQNLQETVLKHHPMAHS
ncbi:tyrosine-type recombinase/integrase [Sulfuricurvum sp. RIFCSPLOWO2_12_FULL_43_24]|uniref:tyrosine-type recombinase/integrase n=1 Tax=Sulfuricurvum sp. RIFCSPLOWO2_12_FULL_43_24 TaxID=1802247 RepID=UPI0008D51FA9|nr:tyrosine-type recombinase/integrase [Sulfuricurvum sp. RIFCSPLOWO2_12_FULL_43_24]OHD87533.1 MAG: integrase [Sulfuricurvum sp. RIFCSPLOWO2_12_43_5]OHD89356.1 MAG: integrase [Sulfuricurvum sp. RIFCSPLOWO2_12_FULL_43_24]